MTPAIGPPACLPYTARLARVSPVPADPLAQPTRFMSELASPPGAACLPLVRVPVSPLLPVAFCYRPSDHVPMHLPLRVLLCALLVATAGCSKALGYDDVRFSPSPVGPDASAQQSEAPDTSSDPVQDGSSVDGARADAAGDSATEASNPCDGVTCSDLGHCTIDDGGVRCVCVDGYHGDGPACVPDETCTGVDCGRCGHCEVVGGKASCTCPDGFVFTGGGCELHPDPCSPNPCDAEHVCVPEAHCTPLGVCVPTCDCSNCGNCGPDNSDGRWDDWQEYCGNLNAQPATMACTKPCPNGDGCIPYNPPMCWPMEGCFSL